jgi:hypothetical protein
MRSRSSVVLSLPVIIFACLVLATNARAQDSVVFQLEDATSHSFFQAFVDRQQAPPKAATPRAGQQIALHALTFGSVRTSSSALLPLVISEPQREITPGQCFGNGAQAAP